MARPKPKPADTLSDRIRAVIQSRRLSAYAVGKESGLNASIVSKFIARERGLTLASAERIASALGLVLVEGRGGLR